MLNLAQPCGKMVQKASKSLVKAGYFSRLTTASVVICRCCREIFHINRTAFAYLSHSFGHSFFSQNLSVNSRLYSLTTGIINTNTNLI